MANWAQGFFEPKHPEKYIGKHKPKYRSGWELTFMQFCDNNKNIIRWASEALVIPYRHPLTGKMANYIPDFFVVYNDRTGRKHAEVWEVKPANQAIRERVGRSKARQAAYIKNQAKWSAANAWCRQQGLKFRVLSESDIFHYGKR